MIFTAHTTQRGRPATTALWRTPTIITENKCLSNLHYKLIFIVGARLIHVLIVLNPISFRHYSARLIRGHSTLVITTLHGREEGSQFP